MNDTRDPALRGPLASSVRMGFTMLYAAVLVLGAAWASGNIHQVPARSTAPSSCALVA